MVTKTLFLISLVFVDFLLPFILLHSLSYKDLYLIIYCCVFWACLHHKEIQDLYFTESLGGTLGISTCALGSVSLDMGVHPPHIGVMTHKKYLTEGLANRKHAMSTAHSSCLLLLQRLLLVSMECRLPALTTC